MQTLTTLFPNKLMDSPSIILKLENCCICTAAKIKHNELLNRIMKDSASQEEMDSLSMKYECVKYFLEKANFAEIREKWPELDGRKNMSVSLTKDRDSFVIRKTEDTDG